MRCGRPFGTRYNLSSRHTGPGADDVALPRFRKITVGAPVPDGVGGPNVPTVGQYVGGRNDTEAHDTFTCSSQCGSLQAFAGQLASALEYGTAQLLATLLILIAGPVLPALWLWLMERPPWRWQFFVPVILAGGVAAIFPRR